MNRRTTLLLAIIALFCTAPGSKMGSDSGSGMNLYRNSGLPNDLCGDQLIGSIRGGPVVTGQYTSLGKIVTGSCRMWTCANFPWSGEIGGRDANDISDYNTATTPGGNSWVMTCDGEADSEGEETKETACFYDGQTIRMSSDADFILAADQLCRGGRLYVPAGHFHFNGCGAQADGTANGCPVTRKNPHQISHRFSIFDDISVIGAGADNDGMVPPDNPLTRSVIIEDYGNATEGYKDLGGPNPSTWEGERWGWRLGRRDYRVTRCYNDGTVDTSQCIAQDLGHEQGNDSLKWTTVPLNPWARNVSFDDTVDISFENPDAVQICVENDVAAGVCSNAPWIPCTNNSARASATTGGCDDFDGEDAGTCVGMADMIESYVDPYDGSGYRDLLFIYGIDETTLYADPLTEDTGGKESYIYLQPTYVAAQGGCPADHRLVHMSFQNQQMVVIDGSVPIYGNDKVFRLDLPRQIVDLGYAKAQGSATITTEPYLRNRNTVVTGFTFIPANWIGRPSANEDADCPSPYTSAECDGIALIATGSTDGGHWYKISTLYGGAEAGAFAVLDGTPIQRNTRISDSTFRNFLGLLSDIGSSLEFDHNLIVGAREVSRPLHAIAFGDGLARYHDNEYYGNFTESLFDCQLGHGAIFERNYIHGNYFRLTGMRLKGCRDMVIRDNYGGGNILRGPMVTIDADGAPDGDTYNVFVLNNRFGALFWDDDSPLHPRAVFAISDFLVKNDFTATVRNVVVEGNSAQIHGDDPIVGIYLGGGTGDDSDEDQGLSRSVDEWRKRVTFRDNDIGIYDDGSSTTFLPIAAGNEFYDAKCVGAGDPLACCSGSGAGDCDANFANDAADANILTLSEITAELPQIENLGFQDQNLSLTEPPDVKRRVAAADVPDCETLQYGSTVSIYDDTTASGTCADADSNGVLDGSSTFSSFCVCDPAGDSGDGAWASPF